MLTLAFAVAALAPPRAPLRVRPAARAPQVRLALFDDLRAQLAAFAPGQPGAVELEDELLSCTSPRETLALFERLEGQSAPPADLLTTATAAAKLDGRWVLEATIAANVGDDDLADSGVNNAVNASGIVLDTSKSAKPVQEIDLAASRIGCAAAHSNTSIHPRVRSSE